jgi:hypothetical protein
VPTIAEWEGLSRAIVGFYGGTTTTENTKKFLDTLLLPYVGLRWTDGTAGQYWNGSSLNNVSTAYASSD